MLLFAVVANSLFVPNYARRILRAVSVHEQMRSLGYEHHDARLADPWDSRCVSLTRTRQTESSHASRSISAVLHGLVSESVSRRTAWPAGFCPFPVFS
jgi:hypothetical protein